MIIDWDYFHDFEKNTDYQKLQLLRDYVECSLPKEYQNLDFLKSTLKYLVKQYSQMTKTEMELLIVDSVQRTDCKSTSNHKAKTSEEREFVKSLIAGGKNNSEISRITGFDRRTIANIRKELN